MFNVKLNIVVIKYKIIIHLNSKILWLMINVHRMLDFLSCHIYIQSFIPEIDGTCKKRIISIIKTACDMSLYFYGFNFLIS